MRRSNRHQQAFNLSVESQANALPRTPERRLYWAMLERLMLDFFQDKPRMIGEKRRQRKGRFGKHPARDDPPFYYIMRKDSHILGFDWVIEQLFEDSEGMAKRARKAVLYLNENKFSKDVEF